MYNVIILKYDENEDLFDIIENLIQNYIDFETRVSILSQQDVNSVLKALKIDFCDPKKVLSNLKEKIGFVEAKNKIQIKFDKKFQIEKFVL